MSDKVKETLCSSCSHREVCAYKQDFFDAIQTIKNMSVIRSASKKITDYDFISEITINCKYYQAFKTCRYGEGLIPMVNFTSSLSSSDQHIAHRYKPGINELIERSKK